MDNLNYVKILFAQTTICIVILASLMNTIENYLPVFITRTFRYGKFAYKGTQNCLINPIEVPKKWFQHFYIFSSIASLVTFVFVISVYIFDNSVPVFVINLLNTVGGTPRYATVTPTATLLAFGLLTLQCCRRFYDTQFVSVFAKHGRMNLTHYLIGFLHYGGAIITILLEAPKFTTVSRTSEIKLTNFSFKEIVGTAIFLWAWLYQYKVTVILANLRKNTNGKIVSNDHHIPEGSLFKYVTSPHMLTEILMYFALTIILWKNTTWWYVFVWVLTNQVEMALLSHWWYQKTFPNYPKERKIILPYIF